MHQKLAEKQTVPNAFGRSANFYHQHANLQKKVARKLIHFLDKQAGGLPGAPILELGCGTGFLSSELVDLFTDRQLIFTDRSPRMLDACRQHIGLLDNLNFKVMDGAQIPTDESLYALVISSFVAQWFASPALTLARWLKTIKPGGMLLAAFPGNESFPEWRAHTQMLGLPFTANTLPAMENIIGPLSSRGAEICCRDDIITQRFRSAADFFRHIKNIGAGTQRQGPHLSAKEMRLLINHWDGQSGGGITVSWQVIFLAVKNKASE